MPRPNDLTTTNRCHFDALGPRAHEYRYFFIWEAWGQLSNDDRYLLPLTFSQRNAGRGSGARNNGPAMYSIVATNLANPTCDEMVERYIRMIRVSEIDGTEAGKYKISGKLPADSAKPMSYSHKRLNVPTTPS